MTKSGTNTIRGSVFEFLRDDSLNATDPFAALGPDGKRRSDGLNRNQYGGSFGGPVVRDRLFYFAAYQHTRVGRVPTSSFQFVPTPLRRLRRATSARQPGARGPVHGTSDVRAVAQS